MPVTPARARTIAASPRLHDDEGLPILLIDLVNCADAGVVEGRSRFGFALKTAERLRVFGYIVRQELEGNEAAEFDVLGFVDNTMPPPSFSTMR